jgi:arginase
LKLRAEVAVKSGALVLVLGGDCAQVIGLLTGARRYYKRISLLWFDRDADLNTPATTPSGRVDGMVVAHVIGKGSPEIVRLWGEPPLVREPDVTLFGLERVDAPEQQFLNNSAVRKVSATDVNTKGAAAAAKAALTNMHADAQQVVLHLDTDVISQEDFAAVNVPGTGGLAFADVRAAFVEFLKNPTLLGLDVAQYNPDKDPDGSGAKKLVDLLVEGLTARLQALQEAEPAGPEAISAPAGATIDASQPATAEAGPDITPEEINEEPAAESAADESALNEAPSAETGDEETGSDEPSDEVSSKETSA